MSSGEALRSFDDDPSLRRRLPSGLGKIGRITSDPSGLEVKALITTGVAAPTRTDEAGQKL